MKYFLIFIIISLSACTTPSFRINQDSVRQPVRDVITEDIRAASDYLAREVNEAPQKEVAISLSQRVGGPERRIESPEIVQSSLAKGERDYRGEIERLNRWLERRAGTPLEGTGINLMGLGGFFLVGGVILLLILVPCLIPLVVSIFRGISGAGYKTLRHTSKGIIKAIEQHKRDDPQGAKKLLDQVRENLDERDKILVEKLRRD